MHYFVVALASACVVIDDNPSDTEGSTGTDGTTGPGTTSTAGTQTDTAATDSGGTTTGTTSTTTSATETDSGTDSAGTSTTGGQAACGWGRTGVADPAEGYICDGNGEDPNGQYPIACPEGLVVGDPCGMVTGVGCCDANGDNWYCTSGSELYKDTCG